MNIQKNREYTKNNQNGVFVTGRNPSNGSAIFGTMVKGEIKSSHNTKSEAARALKKLTNF
jgi:hypothetical protein